MKRVKSVTAVGLITPTEAAHFHVLEVDPAHADVRARDDILVPGRDTAVDLIRVAQNHIDPILVRRLCPKVKRTTKSSTTSAKID